jgi:ABC-type multidrug transport system permease subunit
MYDRLTWFEELTQLIHIFFFFFISFFPVGFFLTNLLNYHIFMTQPCSQTHVQCYWV